MQDIKKIIKRNPVESCLVGVSLLLLLLNSGKILESLADIEQQRQSLGQSQRSIAIEGSRSQLEVQKAKTRILHGNAHQIWNKEVDPSAPAIQVEQGSIYYGIGTEKPLPKGAVIWDAYCRTAIIDEKGRAADIASAQGVCTEIMRELKEYRNGQKQ